MNRCSSWLIFLMLVALARGVQAHNPDTSYARFKVSRESLETKLTYDLFTLVRIAPQLDANADRQVTAAELAAQASSIADYLRQHVKLEIDGRAAEFGDLQTVEFPPNVGDAIQEKDYHAATALVQFVFRKRLSKAPADFWVRFEFFPNFGDLHTVLGVIEQDGKEHQVLFREDEPDYLYDTDYLPTPAPATDSPQPDSSNPSEVATVPEPVAAKKSERSNTNVSLWGQMASFFRLGVEHIFLGYDHILFLLTLIVICKLRELVKIVTSFTVAHTITLILATLEVIQLPGRFVETAIAATIVYVAVENFWIKETARRWPLTFVFGLIHGFGFAGVLRELGLPTVGLVRSLVAFNLGVEVGQLAIVLAIFPLSMLIAKWKHHQRAQRIISGSIALCGLGWFLDRAFGWGLMPF